MSSGLGRAKENRHGRLLFMGMDMFLGGLRRDGHCSLCYLTFVRKGGKGFISSRLDLAPRQGATTPKSRSGRSQGVWIES